MKIQKIKVYQIDLPLIEAEFKFGPKKSVSTFDSTVVEIETDSGIKGIGEACTIGNAYLPAFSKGARAGLRELAPEMIGENPLELKKINHKMDYLLKGHPYVKSALDIACWDVLGKASGLPVCTLLGGRYGDKVQLYRTICQQTPEETARNVLKYKKEGYTKFQLKLGGNVDEDIESIRRTREALDPSDVLICDANCGWQSHEAIRLANAVKDLDIYLEQPCPTYEECLRVRQHTNLPFIIDELADDIHMLMKIHKDNAADAVNIKICKLGGLTKATQARDLCVNIGLAMNLEDSWGGDITTATIAHFAQSTPEAFRFLCTDFNSYNKVRNASGAPERENGFMKASEKPGLGVTPLYETLGQPVFEV